MKTYGIKVLLGVSFFGSIICTPYPNPDIDFEKLHQSNIEKLERDYQKVFNCLKDSTDEKLSKFALMCQHNKQEVLCWKFFLLQRLNGNEEQNSGNSDVT